VAPDEDVYDPRRRRYLEGLQRDENHLVRDEAAYWLQILTTAIPPDLPCEERTRHREALDTLKPRITLMTWSLRFSNHLNQVGQRSYTVRELEEFIDLLKIVRS